jgi:hypothetical protein
LSAGHRDQQVRQVRSTQCPQNASTSNKPEQPPLHSQIASNNSAPNTPGLSTTSPAASAPTPPNQPIRKRQDRTIDHVKVATNITEAFNRRSSERNLSSIQTGPTQLAYLLCKEGKQEKGTCVVIYRNTNSNPEALRPTTHRSPQRRRPRSLFTNEERRQPRNSCSPSKQHQPASTEKAESTSQLPSHDSSSAHKHGAGHLKLSTHIL